MKNAVRQTVLVLVGCLCFTTPSWAAVVTFSGQTEEVQGITQGIPLDLIGIVDEDAVDILPQFNTAGIYEAVVGIISLGSGPTAVLLSFENARFNVFPETDVVSFSVRPQNIVSSVGIPADLEFLDFFASFTGSGFTNETVIGGLESLLISPEKSFEINFREILTGQSFFARGDITETSVTLSAVPEPSSIVVLAMFFGGVALRRSRRKT